MNVQCHHCELNTKQRHCHCAAVVIVSHGSSSCDDESTKLLSATSAFISETLRAASCAFSHAVLKCSPLHPQAVRTHRPVIASQSQATTLVSTL